MAMNKILVDSSNARSIMRSALVFLCLGILLKPSLVEKLDPLSMVVKVASMLVFVGVVACYATKRMKPSKALILFTLFRAWLLVPTLLNHGDILNWGYVSVAQVSLFALIEWEMRSGDKTRALNCLKLIRLLLFVYLFVNCAMVLFDWGLAFPAGSQGSTTWYLLGIRTRITDCFIAALAVSVLVDKLNGRRFGLMSAAVLVVGLVQVLVLEVATALVGFVVLAGAYLLLEFVPAAKKVLTTKTSVVTGVAVCLLVVVAKIQNLFEPIIVGLLNKSLTLTGRTEIWDAALGVVAESPVIGHGINHAYGAFAPYRDGLWQAHNEYIQLVYDGGIIALLIFLAFVVIAGKAIDSTVQGRSLATPMQSALLAFMVMMVVEIYTYNMGLFYLVPFIMNGLDVFVPNPDSSGGRCGKKIGLVGRVDLDRTLFDGQTVKTRMMHRLLCEMYGKDEVFVVDTKDYKRRCLAVLRDTLKCLSCCDDVVVMLSGNGRKVLFPVFAHAAKHRRIKVYHNLIGGSLAANVAERPAMAADLNAFEVNWVESPLLAEQLRDLGVQNVEYLPNFKYYSTGIETSSRPTGSEYRFCVLSRVMAKKGVGDAIAAVSALNQSHDGNSYYLDIYGPIDEGYRDELERLLAAHAEARYCGCVEPEESAAVLGRYSALLFPTQWVCEGVPGTIIDALAAGTPVIASRWQYHDDMLEDGVTGFYYEIGDFDGLVAAMQRFVALPDDGAGMSKACLERFELYSPQAVRVQIAARIVR